MATDQHSVPVIRYQYLQPVQIVHVTNRHVSVLIQSVVMLVWCLCGVHTAAPSTPNFTTATLGRRGLNVTWWPQDGVVYSSGTTFTVHYRRLGIILRPPSRLPVSRSLTARPLMIVIALYCFRVTRAACVKTTAEMQFASSGQSALTIVSE